MMTEMKEELHITDDNIEILDSSTNSDIDDLVDISNSKLKTEISSYNTGEIVLDECNDENNMDVAISKYKIKTEKSDCMTNDNSLNFKPDLKSNYATNSKNYSSKSQEKNQTLEKFIYTEINPEPSCINEEIEIIYSACPKLPGFVKLVDMNDPRFKAPNIASENTKILDISTKNVEEIVLDDVDNDSDIEILEDLHLTITSEEKLNDDQHNLKSNYENKSEDEFDKTEEKYDLRHNKPTLESIHTVNNTFENETTSLKYINSVKPVIIKKLSKSCSKSRDRGNKVLESGNTKNKSKNKRPKKISHLFDKSFVAPTFYNQDNANQEDNNRLLPVEQDINKKIDRSLEASTLHHRDNSNQEGNENRLEPVVQDVNEKVDKCLDKTTFSYRDNIIEEYHTIRHLSSVQDANIKKNPQLMLVINKLKTNLKNMKQNNNPLVENIMNNKLEDETSLKEKCDSSKLIQSFKTENDVMLKLNIHQNSISISDSNVALPVKRKRGRPKKITNSVQSINDSNSNNEEKNTRKKLKKHIFQSENDPNLMSTDKYNIEDFIIMRKRRSEQIEGIVQTQNDKNSISSKNTLQYKKEVKSITGSKNIHNEDLDLMKKNVRKKCKSRKTLIKDAFQFKNDDQRSCGRNFTTENECVTLDDSDLSNTGIESNFDKTSNFTENGTSMENSQKHFSPKNTSNDDNTFEIIECLSSPGSCVVEDSNDSATENPVTVVDIDIKCSTTTNKTFNIGSNYIPVLSNNKMENNGGYYSVHGIVHGPTSESPYALASNSTQFYGSLDSVTSLCNNEFDYSESDSYEVSFPSNNNSVHISTKEAYSSVCSQPFAPTILQTNSIQNEFSENCFLTQENNCNNKYLGETNSHNLIGSQNMQSTLSRSDKTLLDKINACFTDTINLQVRDLTYLVFKIIVDDMCLKNLVQIASTKHTNSKELIKVKDDIKTKITSTGTQFISVLDEIVMSNALFNTTDLIYVLLVKLMTTLVETDQNMSFMLIVKNIIRQLIQQHNYTNETILFVFSLPENEFKFCYCTIQKRLEFLKAHCPEQIVKEESICQSFDNLWETIKESAVSFIDLNKKFRSS